MAVKKVRSSDDEAQKEAAKELQRQIDDIVSGAAPPTPPRNLRDFINEKMAQNSPRKSVRTRSSRKKK